MTPPRAARVAATVCALGAALLATPASGTAVAVAAGVAVAAHRAAVPAASATGAAPAPAGAVPATPAVAATSTSPAVAGATAAATATAPQRAAAAPAAGGRNEPGASAQARPCWLPGYPHAARCGSLRRALDPSRPGGPDVEVAYAVLPALARRPEPDAVLFLAGGPGQGAIDIAGHVARLLGRLGSRRDIVLVDLRGSGRSGALRCEAPDPLAALVAEADRSRRLASLRICRDAIARRPEGDLRFYTTTLAVHDVDAVRRALAIERVNLVAVSYGTRAAIEYQRQFPHAVRRMVLDGVAPPDMALPAAASVDAQAALDAVFAGCDADARCRAHQPRLAARWRELLATLPRAASVAHPFTGEAMTPFVTRELLLGLVRQALYVPSWSAGLPAAIAAAADGRLEPLFGLAASGVDSGARGVAEALHFSVICAEDMAPARAVDGGGGGGGDFGRALADDYAAVCAEWPRGAVPEAFHRVGRSAVPVLLLSGGADPVTPPRHGARAAAALGPLARHVVVPHAGHGLLAIGCLRDAAARFVAAATDAGALAVDFGCAAGVPAPTPFAPPGAAR